MSTVRGDAVRSLAPGEAMSSARAAEAPHPTQSAVDADCSRAKYSAKLVLLRQHTQRRADETPSVEEALGKSTVSFNALIGRPAALYTMVMPLSRDLNHCTILCTLLPQQHNVPVTPIGIECMGMRQVNCIVRLDYKSSSRIDRCHDAFGQLDLCLFFVILIV